MQNKIFKRKWVLVIVLSGVHLLIDFCSMLIISKINLIPSLSKVDLFILVILYDLLAFGLQLPFGIMIDRISKERLFIIISLILGIFSFIFLDIPLLAIILIGLSNAIYHIAAGVIILKISDMKPIIPGLFVAPGAIGLYLGKQLNAISNIELVSIFVLIVFLIIFIFFKIKPYKVNLSFNITNNKKLLIVGLLFAAIFCRAFVGSILVFKWRSEVVLALILTISIFLGKALGGYLNEKYGWIKFSIISLFISLIFLGLFQTSPIGGILGSFSFNLVMAVTLVAIYKATRLAGLAFGLNCFALILGSLPSFFDSGHIFSNQIIEVIFILISIITIYFSFRLLLNKKYNY